MVRTICDVMINCMGFWNMCLNNSMMGLWVVSCSGMIRVWLCDVSLNSMVSCRLHVTWIQRMNRQMSLVVRSGNCHRDIGFGCMSNVAPVIFLFRSKRMAVVFRVSSLIGSFLCRKICNAEADLMTVATRRLPVGLRIASNMASKRNVTLNRLLRGNSCNFRCKSPLSMRFNDVQRRLSYMMLNRMIVSMKRVCHIVVSSINMMLRSMNLGHMGNLMVSTR